ncbi:hypothetical protein UFOVP605_41 [uncultured Caudovirales phage]|uniref:Uncharacterized protein n=1 Tax=uncultured Caudovirales phage TaxID=2100421 RepID=A0A6J5N4Z7_9CAUD|nr:hypothetical protein UFOVP605_41 [uncultured Caudovirales phage]
MFVFNDGGRAASGRKGIAGDCVARAFAIATGMDYSTCYGLLAAANAAAGGKRSARAGVRREVYEAMFAQHGWHWVTAPKFPGRKARCRDMPPGVVIARQAKHVVCVIDGTPHDIFDCTAKMVYGYWQKKS